MKRAYALPTASYFLILAVVVGLFGGCGSPQNTAEQQIVSRLPSVIGPASHYEAHIDGDIMALGRGHANAIVIHGSDVQIGANMTVSSLTLDAQGVSFDRAAKKITHIDHLAISATMSQANVDAYLAARMRQFPGLAVTIEESDVRIDVPVEAYGLQSVAHLEGGLAPSAAGSNMIDFDLNHAQLGRLPLPRALINIAVQEVNPVVSLAGIKIPVALDSVSVVNGRIVLTGTATLPGL